MILSKGLRKTIFKTSIKKAEYLDAYTLDENDEV